jgi:hypothetical protein
MALKGNLETFLLTDILQLLHNDRKTGALQVKNGDDEARFIVKDGAVVCAMSTDKETRLGNLLIAGGYITLERLEPYLDEGKQKKQALGKVLVDRKYMTVEHLKPFIRGQVEEIIYNLFSWETGEFVYRDAMLDISGLVVMPLDIIEIMLAASRRIDDMSVLKKYIPDERLSFKTTNTTNTTGEMQDEQEQEFNLIEDEKKILGIVDGTRCVDDLIRESGLERVIVFKVLHSLLCCGLVEKGECLPGPRQVESQTPGKDYGYAPIISGYHNILEILWRHLEPEIGRETSVIFEVCKPEALPGQKGLFKNYYPNNPLPTNIYAVQENLKILKNIKNQRVFLVESFNRYVLNIMNRVPDLLGVRHTQKILQEIEKVLPYITKYTEGLRLETNSNIVEDLKKIMAKVGYQISHRDKSKGKSTGILSRLKKK